MENFRDLFEGSPKMDIKKLAKLMEKDFKMYGSPRGSREVDKYLIDYMNAALKAAMVEFNKTQASSDIYASWAQNGGAEAGSDEEAGEVEYYEDNYTIEVKEITLGSTE